MRLVTYGTLDGLSSAVLITEVEPIDSIELIHPQAITSKRFKIQEGDILANVPYGAGCTKWFDHHEATQKPPEPPAAVEGKYGQAPSCARLVYDYYRRQNPELERFEELIEQTDRFSIADLAVEEVSHPKRYILLGFTLDPRSGLPGHKAYFHKVLDEIKQMPLDRLLELDEVSQRIGQIADEREAFLEVMAAHSRQAGNVIVTDLRSAENVPAGNRFLIYTLFPDANVSLRIEGSAKRSFVVARAGHSIFNRTCPVHVGFLMSQYGGGGHKGTGAAPLAPEYADRAIEEIIEKLQENNPPA